MSKNASKIIIRAIAITLCALMVISFVSPLVGL